MSESDDLRAFIRDLMARFDRGIDAVLKRIDEDAARRVARAEEFERDFKRREQATERYFKEIRAQQLADRERLDEILAEGKAGRAALFKILDRLDNGGGAASAG
jgi:hypothetical protein